MKSKQKPNLELCIPACKGVEALEANQCSSLFKNDARFCVALVEACPELKIT